MRLDLAERLRCPAAHAATPLIVIARTTHARDLRDGFAGCPVCRLEARVTDGHVRFGGEATARDASGDGPAPELERVIALLGLAEPGGAVLLTGRYASLAAPLAVETGVAAIVLHAATLPASSEAVAAVTGALERVPFGDAAFRGAALDAGLPAALLADAVRTVMVDGRVVADARVHAPTGLKELARDDREWVAARERVGAVVELRRG